MQLPCENNEAKTLHLENILEKPRRWFFKRTTSKFKYQNIGVLTLKGEHAVQTSKRNPK
jgi:hypothetical protein